MKPPRKPINKVYNDYKQKCCKCGKYALHSEMRHSFGRSYCKDCEIKQNDKNKKDDYVIEHVYE